ncbi:Similar to Histidine-rich membrane protein KE4 homolog 1; acc. no. Q9XUC4 [Pyronema omphalodes CBS 100304]|uniref:Similar to Histidine-rich membrane protein KE4 homolog 1 acc. no. Q9XUC4 n=1 Tax=Pyronema omphalodes (strain CBS 100304) TaxID=1076935 RepID=U4LNI0_PYROM|nr:Similar to Histidine-rich membrane protein KE4 homolog 1; acc. no. Q9XUC4 [Pyronema omphalodes CBS 100304]
MSRTRTLLRTAALLSALFAVGALATASLKGTTEPQNLLELSIPDLDNELQKCEFVKELNAQRAAAQPETSSLMKQVLDFLLALCPSNIDPSSLSVMVAFAIGGLLGDTLLHLIPQTFLGEPHDANAHFVLNDPNRNAVLGLFIFIGFATFVAMDKTLRIITGGDGHSHSHSHGAENEYPAPHISPEGVSTGADSTSKDGLKNRKSSKESKDGVVAIPDKKAPSTSIQVSSLLNLISDFTHNITDGLAMSGAFYAGPLVGASTCFAVMLHEIPHEVGDFALLIQGGFTKWQAMGAQFITALGAFTGTLIGIAIQEWSKGDAGVGGIEESVKMGAGIMGTDLKAGDLVLPFTAGTFLYVAFSAVPEVLETTGDRKSEAVKAVKMAVAMVAGFMAMFMISE